ncbi:MAG: nucleotidyltransferase family protein [Myxococcaceae bacterium]
MTEPIAIILAAGEGKRMGMPKAVLEHERGRSFLQTLTSTFQKAGCRVLAVVGAEIEEIRQHPTRAALIENPAWESGQFSSVKVGLRTALEEGAEAVLIQPVDVPLVRASTVKAVLEALEGHEGAFPEFEGAPGHPLALTRAAAEKVLSMEDVPHLEAAQARLDVVRVPTRDPAVVVNLNTPEIYERVLGFAPRMAPRKKQRRTQRA